MQAFVIIEIVKSNPLPWCVNILGVFDNLEGAISTFNSIKQCDFTLSDWVETKKGNNTCWACASGSHYWWIQRQEYKVIPNSRTEAIVELAGTKLALESDIEFGPDFIVSENDDPAENGAYVMCWKWLSFAGTEFDKSTEE